MPVSVKVDQGSVQVGLSDLRTSVADYGPLLRIAGELMRGSIARTFRDEGSPAGSWPRLAASTLKRKGYTSGHKLLILSSRLFGSFTYTVDGPNLIIGTNVPYAPVHQFGSGNLIVRISEHQAARVRAFKRYGKDERTGKDGRRRTVRVRAQGPSNATRYGVKEHTRRMNIRARPFLVFRPEDPSRIALGMEAYLSGKLSRIGTVSNAPQAAGGDA